MHCEGEAKPILLESEVAPHTQMIPAFLGWLGTRYGAVQILVMGTTVWFARLPPWGRIPSILIGGLYLAALVGMGAAGQKRLPQTTDFMRVGEIGAMVLRFILLMAPVWAGLIVLFSFFPFAVWTAWPVLKIVIALYVPAVLMLAAFVPVKSLLTQPWLAVVLVSRIPAEYLRFVAMVVLFLAVDAGIDLGFDTAAEALGDRYVLTWFGSVIGLVIPALVAYLMGWFAHEQAEALGLVRPDPEARFAWPEARPEGTWAPKEAERGIKEPEPIVPIALEEWEGRTATEELPSGRVGERTIDPIAARRRRRVARPRPLQRDRHGAGDAHPRGRADLRVPAAEGGREGRPGGPLAYRSRDRRRRVNAARKSARTAPPRACPPAVVQPHPSSSSTKPSGSPRAIGEMLSCPEPLASR